VNTNTSLKTETVQLHFRPLQTEINFNLMRRLKQPITVIIIKHSC